MTSKILSVAYQGLHCHLVEVEAHISQHLPAFILVGLPDTAIQEARERIRSALENSGLPFPRSKVTVNLAPADIRKEGSLYDLAIAVSIVRASESVVLSDEDSKAAFLGELSLSGQVRPIKGALLAASYLKERGVTRLYIAAANAVEASYIEGVRVFPVSTFSDLVRHLMCEKSITPILSAQIPKASRAPVDSDFADIHGQFQAKRALEIAAAGGHNVLMNGIPGSGKTMLARSFCSILPPLEENEILEVSKIYSCSGLLPSQSAIMTQRPFRSPHHTASVASIIGGGSNPRPGEITLAHRGVLFLDEFPEFQRSVLEALRQPLEDKTVTVSRVSGTLTFPARFIFIAAQNPCPCGAWGDPEKTCVCTEYQRRQYQRKISGPLLDRIDLHVRVYAVKREELLQDAAKEPSLKIIERVIQARTIQKNRFKQGGHLNGDMNHAALKKWCRLDEATREILVISSKKLHLSARSFYKIIKVARTIADLEGQESIQKGHILEALQYRPAE